MSEPPYDSLGHLKVMAGIGAVCVQWSLLEHCTLHLAATIEGMALDKAYLLFGSLNMKQRVDLVINLSRFSKAPTPIVRRMIAIRNAIRDEGLAEGRNRAVHGVHKASEIPDAIQLTLPRERGDKRTRTFTTEDLYKLSVRLSELSKEVNLISEDFFAWKIRVFNNRLDHSKSKFGKTGPGIFLKIAKLLHPGRNR